MTVHIREFVLQLGIDGDADSEAAPPRGEPGVSREDLDALRRDLLRQMREMVADATAPPFDR
jgi:hypothetical protein